MLKLLPRLATLAMVVLFATNCDAVKLTARLISTLDALDITPAAVSLEQGDTLQLEATATGSDGTQLSDVAIEWESTDTTVATITSSGLVSAQSIGNAQAIARANDNSRVVTDTVDVSVTGPTVAGVEVTPAADTVAVDQTAQLTATVVDDDGNTLDRDVTWTSGDTNVATVDGEGLVTGVAEGQITISAEADGVSAEASITVAPAPTGTLTILDPDTLVGGGDTLTLQVEARAEDGSLISDPGVAWSSQDPDIATVDSMGRVTSKAVGTAVIAASAVCCTGAAAAVAVEAGSPVTVEDLHVVAVSADSVTLEWTQVDDGTGDPADYALRYGSPSLAWGGAYDTEETTQGTAVGEPATHTFSGLSDGTEYEFALVSYRGTLNVDAEFGGISNTASAHTGSGGEASVTVSPATVYLSNVGDTVKLTMTATRSDGSVVQNPDVSWTSTDTGVGTVDGAGVVTATGSGTTMIVGAAACCGSDTTSVTVGGAGDGLHPNEPADMTVLAAANGSVAEANDHAFGIASFGPWWGYNGGGSHNVYTVEDQGNPTGSGSAVRLDWQSEYNEAAIANIDFEGGPWKQLYIMHRVVNAPCWDGSGHKWFYMVPSGEGRWGRGIWSSIESGGALRVIDGVNGVAVGSGSGTLHVWAPDEIAMEYLFIAESSPGAGDGQVYVWVNGKLVGSASDVVMADSDTYTADWDALHYYGKANDAPDCHFDVRELYISGK